MDNNRGCKHDWNAFARLAIRMSVPFGPFSPFSISLEQTTELLQKALLGTSNTPVDHQVIQQKLNVAVTALNEAASYMGNVEKKLSDQKQNLDSVMASYSDYQQLAEVEKSKADAFIHEMAVKINEGANRERMWAFTMNIVAGLIVFIVGVIVSDRVKVLWTALRTHY